MSRCHVSVFSCDIDAYWSGESGDKAILFCHVILHKHMIKQTCDSVRRSPLTKVITAPSLILMGYVLGEI